LPGWASGKLTEATQAFYLKTPTEKELEGTGLTVADYEQDPYEVWPENWPAFESFLCVQTQWRVGTNGKTGLDYNVLFRILDDNYQEREAWQQAFNDVRLIEITALEAMSSN